MTGLDLIDRKIVAELMRDATLPVAQIADRVGLSQTPCWKRIQRLEATGVLTGRVAPSGRLTLSVPRSAGAGPYFYNHKFKSSGTPVARHFGSRFPFGHGLSYTSFAYRDLSLAAEALPVAGGTVEVQPTYTWQSKVFFGDDNDIPALQSRNIVRDLIQDEYQDAYGLLNLRVRYTNHS